MPPSKQPKVLLFDIGGVCVVSPFQAILDYELSLDIPPGWVNHCISRSAPHGFWHRLERGEIPMDSAWFSGFTSDLHNSSLWHSFYTTATQKDPSLPKTIPPLPTLDGELLFWEMMRQSRSPDPWMYPALKALKSSGKYILAALSNTVIFPPNHPYSNTSSPGDPRNFFDVFISSAHVGLRKPDPKIYELALKELDKFAREKRGWKDGVKAEEVLFLDDIGENLKAGKKSGFQTIKVNLGRAFEAVDQLEEITGLKLAGDHPRIPVKPMVRKKVAKL
ncbi:epoxide hydrolase [Hyaloscypha bicolor E]|uniref:Epoxide hydrolase n=1 Tax=Hyaloscypha bicolor E TaxID=1095630 RepID=A0A2J6TT74_9HELO|nr:epoxide hydrolase [Hyaloscypha bicolor E]PMD66195.1 epoxide hydrolase [Hyaloscypha bicolor E]